MTKRNYSLQFKIKVCEEYIGTEITFRDITEKYEVHQSTISRWFQLFREYGEEGLQESNSKQRKNGKMPEILTEIDREFPLRAKDRKLEEQNQRLKNLVAEKEIELQILTEKVVEF